MTGSADAWPEGPLLAYVGDDFTGSTDVLDAFSAAGVPTVLFLKPPTDEWVARFAHMRCVGLATDARSRSPEWMDTHLGAAFARMSAFGAPLLQYKVCSTFDSSPRIGSIGKAIDLGVAHSRGAWSPMVVGVPRLKRYQVFGNLFAAGGGSVARLDRHPTMSRHPVTPMHEADLRLHLAQQTARRTELVDLMALRAGEAAATCRATLAGDTPIVLFDVLDDATLAQIGETIWQARGDGLFSASSSGLQYALAAYWREAGLLHSASNLPAATPTDLIAVVSGSCSVVTAGQIAAAREQGFALIRVDIAAVFDAARRRAEIARIVDAAAGACAQGRSPLVYSAEGPDDPAVSSFAQVAAHAALTTSEAAHRLGLALADIMREVLDRVPALRRIVVAGGDSSGAVAGGLDIDALTVDASLTPGAPLCRAWSDHPQRDGLQIVLKGGQMGERDVFSRARSGQP